MKAKTIDSPVPVKEIPKVPEKKYPDFWGDVISDFDGTIDPFLLSKKDPDYAYRYIRDDDKNIKMKTSNVLLDRGGWRVCPMEHLLKIGAVKSDTKLKDGLYRVGDTILVYMPKELYNKKQLYKNKVANAPMEQINRLLKDGDKSVAGLGHPDMLGLQTQKQLKMKDQ